MLEISLPPDGSCTRLFRRASAIAVSVKGLRSVLSNGLHAKFGTAVAGAILAITTAGCAPYPARSALETYSNASTIIHSLTLNGWDVECWGAQDPDRFSCVAKNMELSVGRFILSFDHDRVVIESDKCGGPSFYGLKTFDRQPEADDHLWHRIVNVVVDDARTCDPSKMHELDEFPELVILLLNATK